MTHKIRVDCDKWKDRLTACAVIAIYLVWALMTIGLVYAEYYWINWSLPLLKSSGDWGFFFFIAILLGLLNAVNLYFVINKIYQNQNFIKFECVSGSNDIKNTNTSEKSDGIISNHEYFDQKQKYHYD